MIQELLVGLALAVAIWILILRFRPAKNGEDCGGGCRSCPSSRGGECSNKTNPDHS